MPQPGTSDPIRVATFYHRPIDVPFHGGSLHFKGFVDHLRTSMPILVVAPQTAVGYRANGTNLPSAHIVGFRYLVSSSWECVRFVLKDGLKPRAESARVLVAFDIYVAGFTSIWAKIRRIHLVYYPQDSNEEVTRYWREAGYRGGSIFSWVRWPLEKVGLATADLVLVVSDLMRQKLEAKGVNPGRLRVCTLKRALPRYHLPDVESWRAKLGLGEKIGVVFVGSFQYAPNVRAFHFLKLNIAPKLLDLNPRIRIIVAGLDSEQFATDVPPNMLVLGSVRDLDGLLFACEIGLAPMDIAGGTSGKIIDYVLHDLRIVATREAAQGVQATGGLTVVPLDEFASKISAMVTAGVGTRGGSGPPPIDPTYRSQYVESKDISGIAEEILCFADE